MVNYRRRTAVNAAHAEVPIPSTPTGIAADCHQD
jgi:hypothetical protein